MLMTLLNKSLASTHNTIPLSVIMLVQNVVALGLIRLSSATLPSNTLAALKMELPPIEMRVVREWIPVNIFFIAMLFSGFMTFTMVTVSLVAICKNVTNMFTTVGDYYFFGQPITRNIVFALLLMVVAATLGASNDLVTPEKGINISALTWLTINCFTTSGYTLQIKRSQTQTGISPFACSYYNALIATPIMLLWSLGTGDLYACVHNPNVKDPVLLLSLGVSSFLGFCIGFSVFWCISATSPTTCSMVGAITKVPLAVLGILIFKEPVTHKRIGFIALGLLAGIIYTRTKVLERERQRAKMDDADSFDVEKPVALKTELVKMRSSQHESNESESSSDGGRNRVVTNKEVAVDTCALTRLIK
eukprot:CAMPEP_0167773600 /NCGR_PEP_ID=MMETSP0111_2-20121227/1519_1 /TAXON_ID=91324 /ORGANISM="Lotharella globosa, Strain CCCM811" /LENGTH=361 /DNA_ID=CAMNT_0007663273 /DNA_START=386 /DNA_END=1472 /DNA_ORIENTATION=+